MHIKIELQRILLLVGCFGFNDPLRQYFSLYRAGDCRVVAMVLGNLPVPERPTILITVGQGPIALAEGAGGLDILISSMGVVGWCDGAG